MWQNSKTQIVTKIKKINCDKTQKLKILPNSKTQIVTEPGVNKNPKDKYLDNVGFWPFSVIWTYGQINHKCLKGS